jgi:hypothetical protein
MFDDEDGVAGIAQSREELQQSSHVARVEADRRLIQHVKRVDQLRAQGVREADALRLAAGEGARRAVEGQVVQSDVAQELDASARLLQEVRRNAELELRQPDIFQP